MSYRVIGLDPSFRHFGAVIVEIPSAEGEQPSVRHAICWSTEPIKRKRGIRVADDDMRCVQYLAGSLREWIRDAAATNDLLTPFDPVSPLTGVAVEVPHGGAQNARAARSLGLATGIVGSVLEATKLHTYWVTPDDVKRVAREHFHKRGKITKEDVQAAVRAQLDWSRCSLAYKQDEHSWEHIADAAAAVLAARGGSR